MTTQATNLLDLLGEVPRGHRAPHVLTGRRPVAVISFGSRRKYPIIEMAPQSGSFPKNATQTAMKEIRGSNRRFDVIGTRPLIFERREVRFCPVLVIRRRNVLSSDRVGACKSSPVGK